MATPATPATSLLNWRHWVLFISLAAVPIIIYLSGDRLRATYPEWPAQWPSYYNFADQRQWQGVPNAGDVLSNLPFVFVGTYGLFLAGMMRPRPEPGHAMQEPWERHGWLVLFAGVFLTGFGSGYFHWAPGHGTLFWDRLPMAITFGALGGIFIGDRVSSRWGRRCVWPLTVLACGTVLLWHVTEQRGMGDLRPYAVVQFGVIVLLVMITLLFRSRYTRGWDWIGVIACYVGAKLLEDNDGRVFQSLGGSVSGHSLKHLAAAASTAWMAVHLRHRVLRRFMSKDA
jgi:hypothetical protein